MLPSDVISPIRFLYFLPMAVPRQPVAGFDDATPRFTEPRSVFAEAG